jgi:hypothetical protein
VHLNPPRLIKHVKLHRHLIERQRRLDRDTQRRPQSTQGIILRCKRSHIGSSLAEVLQTRLLVQCPDFFAGGTTAKPAEA